MLLYVFNEHMNMVHQQPLPRGMGLIYLIEFYEKREQLIVGGKEGCFIIDIFIFEKYDATKAVLLDAKGSSITVKIKKLESGS